MKKTLLLSLVLVTALDNRANKQNCYPNDFSYSNLLKGGNNSQMKDAQCGNGMCLAYVTSIDNEKCKAQECDEACQQKNSKDSEFVRLLQQIGGSVNDQISPQKRQGMTSRSGRSQNQIRNSSVVVQTVTIEIDKPSEQDIVTVVKTEVKTITVDTPLQKKTKKKCDGKCKAMKKQLKKKKKCKSDSDSVCSGVEMSDFSSDNQINKAVGKSSTRFTPQISIPPAMNRDSVFGNKGLPSSNKDVTVTQVVEKTKTIDKPFTLYRELTTTVTIEKPLINYKVTTFTKISTQVESVTVTQFKEPNKKSKKLSTAQLENSAEAERVQPTIFPSKQIFPASQQATQEILTQKREEQKTVTMPPVTVIKTIEYSKSSEALNIPVIRTEEQQSLSSKNDVPTSTIIKTVTVGSSIQNIVPVMTTITKTVSKNEEMPVSIERIQTEQPPVSVSTVTKTVTENNQRAINIQENATQVSPPEKPSVSIFDNKKPVTELKKAETAGSTKQKIDCDDVLSCFNIPKKSPERKPKNVEVTKALAKGCEITRDSQKTKPRTICRFYNLSKQMKPQKKSKRKKRTVFKTVYEDEDSLNNSPKTISA